MQVHADHFPEDERDEVWLAEAGARGWTVITRDRGIRYRETELTALKAAGVAAFVLTQLPRFRKWSADISAGCLGRE